MKKIVLSFGLILFFVPLCAMETPKGKLTYSKKSTNLKKLIIEEELRIFDFIKQKNVSEVKECLGNLSKNSISSDCLLEADTGNTPLIRAIKSWEKSLIKKDEAKEVLSAILNHKPFPDPTLKNNKDKTAVDYAKNQKLKCALQEIAHGVKEIEDGKQKISALLAEHKVSSQDQLSEGEQVLSNDMKPQPDSWDEYSKQEDSQK